jgi:hypothetical protein
VSQAGRIRSLLAEGRTVRQVALGLELPEDLVWTVARTTVSCAGQGVKDQPSLCRTCPLTASCASAV